jgi:preprotein translocase subunit SecG
MVIHLTDCFLLVAAVLLQAGKGAEVGATFGGSSQTIFGSRGAATFLSKLTIGAALVFFLTSLGLSVLSKDRSVTGGLIDTQSAAPKKEDPKTDQKETPTAAPAATTSPTITVTPAAPATSTAPSAIQEVAPTTPAAPAPSK